MTITKYDFTKLVTEDYIIKYSVELNRHESPNVGQVDLEKREVQFISDGLWPVDIIMGAKIPSIDGFNSSNSAL